MNYYEHHLGDFAQATGHLSMLEDAAYSRMLRWYYAEEKPLPPDERAICRIVRAVSKAERDAVKAVLGDFFELRDDGYHQRRCDSEIARYRDKQAKAKRSADARWSGHKPQSGGNANASADAMRTHSEGNALQTPDTSHQSPDPKTYTAAAPTEAGRVCGLMRRAGLADTNPGHPELLALLDAGATDAEFVGAAETAAGKHKGFAYAVGTVKRQRAEARQTLQSVHHGPLPTIETPYQRAARERVEQVAPSVAAKAPNGAETATVEVFDVAARRLG